MSREEMPLATPAGYDPPGMDLGGGVEAEWMSWRDHDRIGLIEFHKRPDTGKPCAGAVLFNLPETARAFPDKQRWTVESWEPLTLAPSILCNLCGHHGWIRGGRWEPT